MIDVLIADDHAVMRQGLAMLLEAQPDIRVVGQAADGVEATQLASELGPDVVLMDISMPNLDGVAATQAVYEHDPGVAVVMLTTFADSSKVLASLEAGAVGYLMKDSDPAEVVAGVRSAAGGGSPLDPRVARHLVELQRDRQPAVGGRDGGPDVALTPKQREVLQLVAEGLSNRLIARRLDISEKTVKSHLTTVYGLLNVTDRVQAALWAQRNLSDQ